MLCEVCESDQREVFTNELWTGKFHSACCHAACGGCIQRHVEEYLPVCWREMQVRVRCFAPGCSLMLPAALVYKFSARAAELAAALEAQNDWLGVSRRCPLCDEPCCAVVDAAAACGACWLKRCAAQVDRCEEEGRLRVTCCHDGCEEVVGTAFWQRLAAWEAAGSALAVEQRGGLLPLSQRLLAFNLAVDAERARYEPMAPWRPQSEAAPGPVCPICQEHRTALLRDTKAGAACDAHAVCERCLVRWAEERVETCVARREVAVPCLAPGCQEDISLRLWQFIAPGSPPLAALERRLALRRRLLANELYPEPLQVDCPVDGCVGLAYLGFDTCMCFVCEHTWVPDGSDGEAPTTDAEQVMGLVVKRCPKCNEYIEKNGGCDHMTCRCKYEFFWSTLKPYRPGR